MSDKKILTTSQQKTFRECPRKCYFAYELGRVVNSERSSLAFGRAWHEAVARIWSDGTAAAIQYLKDRSADFDDETGGKLAVMIEFYRPPVDQFEVIEIEANFEMPIVNPETGRAMREYLMAGRVDGLLKKKADGSIWIIEHKTTSEEITGFSAYWQRLAIDSQVSNYIQAKGAKGVIYDVARKPSIKPCGKDQKAADIAGVSLIDAYVERCRAEYQGDPEKYFQFREIEKTADDLTEAQSDLWQQAHIYSDCERLNRWPRNCNSCRSFYGTCEYLNVCTGHDTIDNDMSFRTKESKNEELAIVP